jgi:hypothetical protein
MRVPYSWLREYCDPGVPAEELAERLVMTGTEVERIDVVGPPSPDNFVIGKVTEARGRSSAAPPTSAPARPSPSPSPARGCRAARSCARRSCAASPPKG